MKPINTILCRAMLMVLFLVCGHKMAQAGAAEIWWPGWMISSSEELSEGIRYSHSVDIPSYPLALMFDNDPATAWVYSSKTKNYDRMEFSSRFAIKLEPRHPVTIDGLRLMNGQNQNLQRFLRNDRVTRVRVMLQAKRNRFQRTFTIPDHMGWHTLALPHLPMRALTVEFISSVKGRGPGSDLCISELSLLNHGRKIDLHMPRAVMYYDGLEGCNAAYLITHHGQILDGVAFDAGFEDIWNSNGRYVCGVGIVEHPHFWVADVGRAKIVRRIPLPDLENCDYHWRDNRSLQLTFRVGGKRKSEILHLPG